MKEARCRLFIIKQLHAMGDRETAKIYIKYLLQIKKLLVELMEEEENNKVA